MVEIPQYFEQEVSLSGAAVLENSLMEIWADHYLQSQIIARSPEISTAEIIAQSSQASRAKTVEKLQKYLKFDCELGSLRTNTILAVANVINLGEARFLAQSIEKVYANLLLLYQLTHLPIPSLTAEDISDLLLQSQDWTTPDASAMTRLAKSMNPVLAELQEHHLMAQDPRIIGFVTTQFHFTTQEIYKRLTPVEQYLLRPYFQFAEEQVCIPWERICESAANYPEDSLKLTIAKKFLTNSYQTSVKVYQKAIELYPDFQTRRGALNSPLIRASSLRDITMLQGYLALAFLEDDMSAIEQKLLPLCLIVFPKLDVKWNFVRHGLAILVAAIYVQLTPQERKLLHPYAKAMLQLFAI